LLKTTCLKPQELKFSGYNLNRGIEKGFRLSTLRRNSDYYSEAYTDYPCTQLRAKTVPTAIQKNNSTNNHSKECGDSLNNNYKYPSFNLEDSNPH